MKVTIEIFKLIIIDLYNLIGRNIRIIQVASEYSDGLFQIDQEKELRFTNERHR